MVLPEKTKLHQNTTRVAVEKKPTFLIDPRADPGPGSRQCVDTGWTS